jgi:hypothetical protein
LRKSPSGCATNWSSKVALSYCAFKRLCVALTPMWWPSAGVKPSRADATVRVKPSLSGL